MALVAPDFAQGYANAWGHPMHGWGDPLGLTPCSRILLQSCILSVTPSPISPASQCPVRPLRLSLGL